MVLKLRTTPPHPCCMQVVQDNADLRSELFGEHPAQQHECARRRREYLTEVESLIAGATKYRVDYDLAEKHTQRALQVHPRCCPAQRSSVMR